MFSVATRYYWRETASRTLFLGLAADRGVNLDVDKQLTLGGDNGLRGYPLRYRTGQGRWLFTVEERAFTDWYPFRLFNVGGAVFYDMGATLGESQVPIAVTKVSATDARGLACHCLRLPGASGVWSGFNASRISNPQVAGSFPVPA